MVALPTVMVSVKGIQPFRFSDTSMAISASLASPVPRSIFCCSSILTGAALPVAPVYIDSWR